jgi:hypothetical protein
LVTLPDVEAKIDLRKISEPWPREAKNARVAKVESDQGHVRKTIEEIELESGGQMALEKRRLDRVVEQTQALPPGA